MNDYVVLFTFISAGAVMQHDLETRAATIDHSELRLWLRLLTCTSLIENRIRNYLRVQFDCTLPRFDLMAQLAKEPQGMRMGDLSARLMVSNGNVTTIANQLEKEGLILRKVSSEDRRSTFLRLSAKGRRQFDQMASAHEAWLQDMFSDMPKSNQKDLYTLLADLKQAALASQQ